MDFNLANNFQAIVDASHHFITAESLSNVFKGASGAVIGAVISSGIQSVLIKNKTALQEEELKLSNIISKSLEVGCVSIVPLMGLFGALSHCAHAVSNSAPVDHAVIGCGATLVAMPAILLALKK